MDEEDILKKLTGLLITKIPVNNKITGRPYSVTNEQLIKSIFLCTQIWCNMEARV